MTEIVNAVIFNDRNQLLVIKREDFWTLPGEELREREEDVSCLERWIKEKLLGARIRVREFYDFFEEDHTTIRVYLASLQEGLKGHSKDISDVTWMAADKRRTYSLSESTRKIVDELCAKGIYTGR